MSDDKVWIVYRMLGDDKELEIIFTSEESAWKYVYRRNYNRYDVEEEIVYQ